MKELNPLEIRRKMQPSSTNILSSIVKNLNLIQGPETLTIFSGICKIIYEKFKDNHFSFISFIEMKLLMLSLKYLQIKQLCLMTFR